MGIRKDEMIQVTTFSKETIEKIQATVAEAQKKQTLTYKIKNFFKNILKFKKQLLTLQKMTEELYDWLKREYIYSNIKKYHKYQIGIVLYIEINII